MHQVITTALSELAKRHGVRILFAAESGSRAFGYASQDSDYDVRFVYVRPASWYLSVRERRDVIEHKIGKNLDIVGWDLRKALFQMGRGNPQLAEWLTSSLTYQETEAREEMRMLQRGYFNPRTAIFHYLHMAIGNYNKYIRHEDCPRHKKYIYVIRPLLACAFIEDEHTMPRMDIDSLMYVAQSKGPLIHSLNEIVKRKKSGDEMSFGPHITELDAWIEERFDHFTRVAATSAREKLGYDDLDNFFMTQVLQ